MSEETIESCDNPRGYKYARYICRCVSCKTALYREQKRNKINRELGHSDPFINLRDVRYRMRQLKSRGFSLQQQADFCGYSWTQMQKIFKTPPAGGPKKVRQSLLRKLEQFELETRGTKPPRGRARSDVTNVDLASAAVRALMYQGYSQPWISAELEKMFDRGISVDHLSHIATEKVLMVEKNTEQMLVALVKAVGNTPGPNKATATRARQRGYLAAANFDALV